MKGDPQKVLKDAEFKIQLEPCCPKNYFRKCEALWALKRYDEINDVIKEGSKYDNEMFKEIEEKTQKQLEIKKVYSKLIEPNINVQYIDKLKGKGIFSQKNFDKGSVIMKEKPYIAILMIN